MKSVVKYETPLSASIELTRKCNLKCKHCYIVEGKWNELTTQEWKRVLDELKELGVLFLTITGGEPMMREDFFPIAEHASDNFVLRIFTNGTFITEEKAKSLSKMNILEVEVSVHGGEKFHDAFTGKKGAWKKTLEGIELLRKRGIKVNLKMNVLKGNLREMEKVAKIAEKFNSPVLFDPVIVPKETGERDVLALRSKKVKEVIRKTKEFSSGKRRKSDGWKTHPENFLCPAGVTTLSIDSGGNVMPCVGWRWNCGNVKEKKVREIFYGEEMEKVREINKRFRNKCSGCKLTEFCEFCIGLSLAENGGEVEPVRFLCKIASEKKRIFMEAENDSCDKA